MARVLKRGHMGFERLEIMTPAWFMRRYEIERAATAQLVHRIVDDFFQVTCLGKERTD
jgi:hypothetical protein